MLRFIFINFTNHKDKEIITAQFGKLYIIIVIVLPILPVNKYNPTFFCTQGLVL